MSHDSHTGIPQDARDPNELRVFLKFTTHKFSNLLHTHSHTGIPHDATDPDEFRAFFSKYGEVADVAIGLNNGKLIDL